VLSASGVWGGAPAHIEFGAFWPYNMTSGDNNFNHFAENQLIKFNARDAGDFNDAAGEREMAPKCGSLPRDARDVVGLNFIFS